MEFRGDFYVEEVVVVGEVLGVMGILRRFYFRVLV